MFATYEETVIHYKWLLNHPVIDTVKVRAMLCEHPELITHQNQAGHTIVELSIICGNQVFLKILFDRGIPVIPDSDFTHTTLKDPTQWYKYRWLVQYHILNIDYFYSLSDGRQVTLRDIYDEHFGAAPKQNIEGWLNQNNARSYYYASSNDPFFYGFPDLIFTDITSNAADTDPSSDNDPNYDNREAAKPISLTPVAATERPATSRSPVIRGRGRGPRSGRGRR